MKVENKILKCTYCKKEFNICDFAIDKRGKLSKRCKKCFERFKNYRERSKEITKKKSAEYYIKNKKDILLKCKDYRDNNKDKINEYQQKYYKKNKERVNKRHKTHYKKYYQENKELLKEKRRKYSKENPEKNKINSHKRRAVVNKVGGTYTLFQIKKLFHKQYGKCFYCGKNIDNKYHIDHYIPLSKGGNNWISNLRLSCPHCNLCKKDKLPEDYLKEIEKMHLLLWKGIEK